MITTFQLSLIQRFNRASQLVLGIVPTVLVLPTILIGIFRLIFIPTERASVTNWGEAITLIGFSILIVLFFAVLGSSLHLRFPTIHIREDGFRITTLLYKSPWFSWDCIERVEDLKRFNRTVGVYGVFVDDIHPLYRFMTLTEQRPGRAFFFNAYLPNYKRLLHTLETHRPDLFPLK